MFSLEIIVCMLIVALIYVTYYKKENFSQPDVYEYIKSVDDRFSDGLDNNFGIKKQHRHHSF